MICFGNPIKPTKSYFLPRLLVIQIVSNLHYLNTDAMKWVVSDKIAFKLLEVLLKGRFATLQPYLQYDLTERERETERERD